MTLKNIFANMKRYSFLMKQLIIRDFKVKYKRSFLGILWSLLYPVLMMAVMATVFSQMFKYRMDNVNYLVYLMTGLIMFNYFSEASNTAMVSVVTNFGLINKVYIPKYIFPISKVLFVGINFLLTLIPLFVIILVTGSGETRCIINLWYLLLPYVFLCMLLFTAGLGLLLSAVSVFLRDMFYIYGIILTIWNYVTPVFYDIGIIPDNLQPLFKMNPLYIFINSARTIILYGKCPNGIDLLSMLLIGLGTLLLGSIVFKKNQDKFIYYV
ncbi:MAG: ABC transporter permease [Bacilli bacterium]|nr:ABC transporter permease [Bacilli bacterium]